MCFTMIGVFVASLCLIFTSTMTSCGPVNRANLRCQVGGEIERLLQDSSILSSIIQRKIIRASSTIQKRWLQRPNGIYEEANIDIFVVPDKFNTTTVKPRLVLKTSRCILRTFVSLINNYTFQLEHAQTDQEVSNQLRTLTREAKTFISILNKTLALIKLRDQTDIKASRGVAKVHVYTPASVTSSLTLHHIALRTRVVLDEFYSNILTISNDLRNLNGQFCQ